MSAMCAKLVVMLVMLATFFASADSFGVISSTKLIIKGRRSEMSMNFFDNLKVIFSKEGQANIKALNDAEKEEALAAQKEILARRSDPKKMRAYEEKNEANRRKLAEERAVYKFQGKVEDGTHTA